MRGWNGIILLAVCAINLFPLLAWDPGTDTLYHLVSIPCFAEQFWQGDLYPRWCFSANFSFGSPHFAIYYPLAYYIAALTYPLLHALGLSVLHIFLFNLFLAAAFLVYTTRRWLMPIVKSQAATLAAVLVLSLPYRLEALVYRDAIGELWCMALAPLAFHALRQLVRWGRGTLTLGVTFGLMLLANVPAALGALLACGLYALWHGRKAPRIWLQFALAMLPAALIAGIYAVPAAAYVHFLRHDRFSIAPAVNSYVTHLSQERPENVPVLVASVFFTLFYFTACAVLTLLRARRTAGERGEAGLWVCIGLALILLLFPVSAPFWDLINRVALVGFPWRLQMTLSLIIIYLIALLLRDARRRGDAYLLAAFQMFLLPVLFVMRLAPGQEGIIDDIITTRGITTRSYQTVWAEEEYHQWKRYRRMAQETPGHVEITAGYCAARVQQWNWQAIIVQVDAQTPCTLRLHHLYFPLWRLAQREEGTGFGPEPASGLMQLTAPVGHHSITIRMPGVLTVLEESIRQVALGEPHG